MSAWCWVLLGRWTNPIGDPKKDRVCWETVSCLEDLTSPCSGLKNVGLLNLSFWWCRYLGHSFITNVSPKKVKLVNKFQFSPGHQPLALAANIFQLGNAPKISHSCAAKKTKKTKKVYTFPILMWFIVFFLFLYGFVDLSVPYSFRWCVLNIVPWWCSPKSVPAKIASKGNRGWIGWWACKSGFLLKFGKVDVAGKQRWIHLMESLSLGLFHWFATIKLMRDRSWGLGWWFKAWKCAPGSEEHLLFHAYVDQYSWSKIKGFHACHFCLPVPIDC